MPGLAGRDGRVDRPAAGGPGPGAPRRAIADPAATTTRTLATGGTLHLRTELTALEYDELRGAKEGETVLAFEDRIVRLLLVGWDYTLDAEPVPVGGDDTIDALANFDPLVAYDVRTAVVEHRKALYQAYEEAAKALGLLRPLEDEAAAPRTTGRAASSSSRGRGSSARTASAAGAS